MLLVDVFDVYDKVKQGLVEKKHLDMRVHMLRTGIFRSPTGARLWSFWKTVRDQEFVDWFEKNVVDPNAMAEFIEKFREDNPDEGDYKKGETNSFIRTE